MSKEEDSPIIDEKVVNESTQITLASIMALRKYGQISKRDGARFTLEIDKSLVHANNVVLSMRMLVGKNDPGERVN